MIPYDDIVTSWSNDNFKKTLNSDVVHKNHLRFVFAAKSQLSVVSFELSRIANVLHCAVLVVNHSRSSKLADQKGFTEERRNLGCLGFSWAAVPHKRLVLTLSNERAPNSERKLHVLIKLSKDANSQIPCPCEDTTFSSCIVKFPS